MARYPLFGTEQEGRSPHPSSQRRVNLYAESRSDRSPIVWHNRPGLTLFADAGETAWRGLWPLGDTLYGVHRGAFYTINNAGVLTSKGTLDTVSGRVGMTDNGSEVLVVDGTEGYIYNLAGDTFTKIADADFPVANTCAYQGGFFIVDSADEPGRFYISASFDGTSWDALDFATAESNVADQLVAVFVDHGELILFGDITTEHWSNVGATDFPFIRIDGAVVEWGLAARWSIAKHDNTVCYLAKNRMGEVQVMRLAGYQPQRISNPQVEHKLNAYSTVSDASGFAFMADGHPFYQLNFPTAGASWVFDGLTGLWSEWQYGTEGARHRAEFSAQFLNKTIVSDHENGKLYKVNSEAYADNGVPFRWELTSSHVFDEEYLSISRLWLDLETGVGTASGAGENPQLMLQVSKDGGHTWGNERWTGAGKIGQYGTRAIWRSLGRAYEWTMRVAGADPVRTAISGAWVDAQ